MSRDDAATPDDLGVVQHPSPRLWVARQVLLFSVAAVVALLIVVPALVSGSRSAAGIGIGVVAAVTLVVWFLLRGRYRSWSYTEREDDLIVSRGFLIQRLSVVPYGRMQMLDVTAGLVDRGFGLATVRLHTASATTDARIPGLHRAEAERLRDKLSQLGEARGAGL